MIKLFLGLAFTVFLLFPFVSGQVTPNYSYIGPKGVGFIAHARSDLPSGQCWSDYSFMVPVDASNVLCIGPNTWKSDYGFLNSDDEVNYVNNCPAESRFPFFDPTNPQKILAFGCSNCGDNWWCRKIAKDASGCDFPLGNSPNSTDYTRVLCEYSRFISPTGGQIAWHPAASLTNQDCSATDKDYPITISLKKSYGDDNYLCLEPTWATDFGFFNSKQQQTWINNCPTQQITILKSSTAENQILAFGCSDCTTAKGECQPVVFSSETCPTGTAIPETNGGLTSYNCMYGQAQRFSPNASDSATSSVSSSSGSPASSVGYTSSSQSLPPAQSMSPNVPQTQLQYSYGPASGYVAGSSYPVAPSGAAQMQTYSVGPSSYAQQFSYGYSIVAGGGGYGMGVGGASTSPYGQ